MKRFLILSLCFVLFHAVLAADAFALAPVTAPKPPRNAARVADSVAQLGAGESSIVALRLVDQEVVKGVITEIGPDSFVVKDNGSGLSREVPYAGVARFEGMNLVSGAKTHVGGGFTAGVMRAAALLLPVHPAMRNNLTNSEKTLLLAALIGLLLGILLAKAL